MRTFVTGIAGFLGARLAAEAIDRGWEAAGIDSMLSADAANVPDGVQWERADCRDPHAYQDLLDGVDVVYHCAAAPYEGLSVFSPQVVWENTCISTIGLLRASINAGVKRFVFTSSMSRYGHGEAPFTEEMPTAPVDPYGVAKVAAEDAVKNLCDLHGVEWCIAVPHNVFGPGQRYWDPYRNVPAIMANRVLSGKPPVVYGDGSHRRSLSYIADVVAPMIAMAGDPAAAGQVFNVGPGGAGVTIRELAHKIVRLAGAGFEPEFYPDRPSEVRDAYCSDEKTRRVLGYECQWDLDAGLEKLIAWIAEKGPRPFDYHLPLEITNTPLQTPRTWTERLM
jgi:UDP-glucose 4-epimerase